MAWRDNDSLRDDRDRAENEIETLENERDNLDALYGQSEDADVIRECELRLEAIKAELRWLYREVEDIEDVLPPERAWVAGVL